MCFSPEASFTAAAVLGALGYASVKSALRAKKMLLVALIPCIFASQQFAEGIVWLELKSILAPTVLTNFAKYFYLFIAFALWPLWIPFSLFVSETHKLKKALLFILFALGAIFAFKILQAIPLTNVNAMIFNNSIQYEGKDPFNIKTLYALIVLVPCFLSSIRYMWVFGILIGVSYVVAEYFYTNTFTSVWCFLAAILSVAIFSIIRTNEKTY